MTGRATGAPAGAAEKKKPRRCSIVVAGWYSETMMVRACKVRPNDGLCVAKTVFIVSETREDFVGDYATTTIFARPLGRSRLEDRTFCVSPDALVEIIRDRKVAK